MYDHAGRPLHPEAFMPSLTVDGTPQSGGPAQQQQQGPASADRALAPKPPPVITPDDVNSLTS
eukprot:7076313-Prymnesium_polylepis.1